MTAPTRQQTLDQRRATHAWDAVKKVIDIHKKDQKAKDFGTASKKLPTRIMSAGLGQALAFLLGKGKTPLLLVALSDWVLAKRPDDKNDRQMPVETDTAAQRALLVSLIGPNADATTLRRATDETLAYLQWLNRFAEAEGITDGEDLS